MTVRPGAEWGVAVDRPDDLLVVADDADLASCVIDGAARPLAVSGGDLHRSLGAPAVRATMQRVPIDRLRVTADGVVHVAVAHVVARRSWWRGRIVAVSNVDHVGVWNIAPRAHPNDGRFDVVDVAASMSVRHRWQARARLPQGTHVPHPDITVRTGTVGSWEFDRPQRLWVDGRRRGTVRHLEVAIEPDAFELHI